MNVTLTCRQCGKPFSVVPAKAKQQYCSRECSGLGRRRRVVRQCEYCGASFEVTAALAERHPAKYCSVDCMAAAFRVAAERRRDFVERECLTCGKSFRVAPYRLKGKRGKYCSRACWRASRPEDIQCTCQQCGKVFYVYASVARRGGGLYCSQACTGQAKQTGEYRNCKVCGQPFYAQSEQIALNRGLYCSSRCAGIALRRVNQGARHGWRANAWRKAVLERDHYTCQQCGQRGGKLHAHHVKGWTRFPALRYDVANGLTLCVKCHEGVHSRFYRHYTTGSRVQRHRG